MIFSSTLTIPEVSSLPSHLAIVMDGNGRWASRRNQSRAMGHIRGVAAVRRVVSSCASLGISYLTLFAFSSENWRRPPEEVSFLMRLFIRMLDKEVNKLHRNNIRLRIIGSRARFDDLLLERIERAESLTIGNDGLLLNIAVDYGGRWDILQAVNSLLRSRGDVVSLVSELEFSKFLFLSDIPEPDLFIRTGGEQRLSNFLIWQLAYTELYFTSVLWPDFGEVELFKALDFYAGRERRFGRTSSQLSFKEG